MISSSFPLPKEDHFSEPAVHRGGFFFRKTLEVPSFSLFRGCPPELYSAIPQPTVTAEPFPSPLYLFEIVFASWRFLLSFSPDGHLIAHRPFLYLPFLFSDDQRDGGHPPSLFFSPSSAATNRITPTRLIYFIFFLTQ